MLLLLRDEQDAHLDKVHPSIFISGSNDHPTSTNTIKCLHNTTDTILPSSDVMLLGVVSCTLECGSQFLSDNIPQLPSEFRWCRMFQNRACPEHQICLCHIHTVKKKQKHANVYLSMCIPFFWSLSFLLNRPIQLRFE